MSISFKSTLTRLLIERVWIIFFHLSSSSFAVFSFHFCHFFTWCASPSHLSAVRRLLSHFRCWCCLFSSLLSSISRVPLPVTGPNREGNSQERQCNLKHLKEMKSTDTTRPSELRLTQTRKGFGTGERTLDMIKWNLFQFCIRKGAWTRLQYIHTHIGCSMREMGTLNL